MKLRKYKSGRKFTILRKYCPIFSYQKNIVLFVTVSWQMRNHYASTCYKSSTCYQGWNYQLVIDNRWRYSLLFLSNIDSSLLSTIDFQPCLLPAKNCSGPDLVLNHSIWLQRKAVEFIKNYQP